MDQDKEKAEEEGQPPIMMEGNSGEENNPPTDERFQFNDSLWKRVRKEESKKGIVYLADVPIGLTAARLREIFSQYGSVNRIHLNRVKDEGEEGEVKYQDGYIEFLNKKDAMKAVRTLNNQLIGGKKRNNMVRDSFWHLKFIKDNFLWSDIMSSALYRRMSRKDKFTHALKDMYKGYEAYVEKNAGSTHEKVRRGDRPRKREKGGFSRVKKQICPLRFVTVKKGGENGEAKEEVPPEVSHEEPPSLRPNSNAVSADLLKLLM
ncbi:hypothetical protein AK88_02490 [Plasmodium fragile]|uniref:RRM domain-containing protein n=1 Tax=Plasmodium fragile TaxID=5857 RepID=A0A0D9QQB8_PLAFR|nr:uncharacterized protein AK88_02490 [Plasmodium fragile]KJP87886.1 hypothetical protein AK88_02490 [Plasmodium fragile]